LKEDYMSENAETRIHYTTPTPHGKHFSVCQVPTLSDHSPSFFSDSVFECDATLAGYPYSGLYLSSSRVAAGKKVTIADIKGPELDVSHWSIDQKATLELCDLDVRFLPIVGYKLEKDARLDITRAKMEYAGFHTSSFGEGSVIYITQSDVGHTHFPDVADMKHFSFRGATDLGRSHLTLEQLAAAHYVAPECLLPDGITHNDIAEARAAMASGGPRAPVMVAGATHAPSVA
jgi:hypothetical protein